MMPSVVAAKGADQAAAVPHLKLGPIAGYLLKAGIIPEWLMTSDRSTGTIWQAAGRSAACARPAPTPRVRGYEGTRGTRLSADAGPRSGPRRSLLPGLSL